MFEKFLKQVRSKVVWHSVDTVKVEEFTASTKYGVEFDVPFPDLAFNGVDMSLRVR